MTFLPKIAKIAKRIVPRSTSWAPLKTRGKSTYSRFTSGRNNIGGRIREGLKNFEFYNLIDESRNGKRITIPGALKKVVEMRMARREYNRRMREAWLSAPMSKKHIAGYRFSELAELEETYYPAGLTLLEHMIRDLPNEEIKDSEKVKKEVEHYEARAIVLLSELGKAFLNIFKGEDIDADIKASKEYLKKLDEDIVKLNIEHRELALKMKVAFKSKEKEKELSQEEQRLKIALEILRNDKSEFKKWIGTLKFIKGNLDKLSNEKYHATLRQKPELKQEILAETAHALVNVLFNKERDYKNREEIGKLFSEFGEALAKEGSSPGEVVELFRRRAGNTLGVYLTNKLLKLSPVLLILLLAMLSIQWAKYGMKETQNLMIDLRNKFQDLKEIISDKEMRKISTEKDIKKIQELLNKIESQMNRFDELGEKIGEGLAELGTFKLKVKTTKWFMDKYCSSTERHEIIDNLHKIYNELADDKSALGKKYGSLIEKFRIKNEIIQLKEKIKSEYRILKQHVIRQDERYKKATSEDKGKLDKWIGQEIKNVLANLEKQEEMKIRNVEELEILRVELSEHMERLKNYKKNPTRVIYQVLGSPNQVKSTEQSLFESAKNYLEKIFQ